MNDNDQNESNDQNLKIHFNAYFSTVTMKY